MSGDVGTWDAGRGPGRRRSPGWWRTVLLVTGTLTLGLVGSLVDRLLDQGGLLTVVGVLFAASIGITMVVSYWRAGRADAADGGGDAPGPLREYADLAEEHVASLGAADGGPAAAEWFGASAPTMCGTVRACANGEQAPTPDEVEDLARICDALDTWYVRLGDGAGLLETSDHLKTIARRAGRPDLAALAAVRAAAGHRLTGDLGEASRELGRSEGISFRGPTAAAIEARRHTEWALIYLGKAGRATGEGERDLPPEDVADALQNARHRLDDASRRLPRSDVGAEIALRINYGVLSLHRGRTAAARRHLDAAVGRAQLVKDTSAEAHAVELLGVAAWLDGNRDAAAIEWREALRLYTEVAETAGVDRCRGYLGPLEPSVAPSGRRARVPGIRRFLRRVPPS